MARTLRVEERDATGALVAWSELLVHDDPRACAIHAAMGILVLSPMSDGRVRAMERLTAAAGGEATEAVLEEAVILALRIIQGAIEWRGMRPSSGPTSSP